MKAFKLVVLFAIALIVIFVMVISGLPNASVTIDGKRATVLQSSYCWNEIWRQQCVDYITPSEQLKEKGVIPTVVAPESNIQIKFSKKPTEEIYISVWDNDHIGDIEITENTFTAPKEQGIYIYVISGRWSKGSASYVFSVEVK